MLEEPVKEKKEKPIGHDLGAFAGLRFAIERRLAESLMPINEAEPIATLPSCFNIGEIDLARHASHDPNKIHDSSMMAHLSLSDAGRVLTFSKRPVVLGTMMELYTANKMKKEGYVPADHKLLGFNTRFVAMLFPDERFYLDVVRNVQEVKNAQGSIYTAHMFAHPDKYLHLTMDLEFSSNPNAAFKSSNHKDEGSIAIPLSLDGLVNYSKAIHSNGNDPVSYLLALSSGAIVKSIDTDETLAEFKSDEVFPVYATHDVSINPKLHSLVAEGLAEHGEILFNVSPRKRSKIYTVKVDAYLRSKKELISLPEHIYSFRSSIATVPRTKLIEEGLMNTQSPLTKLLMVLDPRRYIT